MDCFYCTAPDKPVCESCELVGSCPDHLRLHRPEGECMPFKVGNLLGKGNCLVAVRDIKPYQTILMDHPAIIGPFDNSELQCLECCKPMDEYHPCSMCSLPLCSSECEAGSQHGVECKYFQKSKPYNPGVDMSVMYSSIAPIRMLAVKENKPEVWNLVDRLEDHLEERKKGDQWNFLTDHVFPFLQENCDLDFDLNVIQRIIGIFRTNSVKWERKIEDKERPVGHALCPLFSVLCHSCVNNTRYTQENNTITVRACVPIKKGEEITTQYRGPNDGNVLRRSDFPKYWMFECSCIRCQDPTELDTHSSTIRCIQCREPNLYPRDSNMKSDWECRSCGFTVEHNIPLGITIKLEERLYKKSYSDTPVSWETFLDELYEKLHQNNFICMKAKRIILQIYGVREGYRLKELSAAQLERKIDLCRNYLDVMGVLEPGYRVWRGRILEEMLGPLTMMLQMKMQAQEIGKLEYMLRYKEIINMIREASKCRQFLERNLQNDSMMGEFYAKWVQPLTKIINS